MEEIKRLRKIFKKFGLDGYIVPKNDEFFSEYVSSNNDRLNFISKFSGSFGYSLILKSSNYLFVDGRYTLQANKQSSNFFNIVTLPNKLPKDILKNKKLIIGFDPKLFTSKTLKILFDKCICKLVPVKDNLIDKIWKRKMKNKIKKFYLLPKNSFGENYKLKVNRIVSNLKKNGVDFQFVTSSENNAWLLNIRGGDSEFTPIPHSHILISKKGDIKFFCDLKKLTPSLKKKLKKVEFIEIKSIDNSLSNIQDKTFIIDKNTCSIYFERSILNKNRILNLEDPIYYLKSIKNKKEIKNIKNTHLLDGAALTKYLFWIKQNFLDRKITEISGSEKLLSMRKKNRSFKSLSFPTISGAGPNGAIIHYKATKKTNRLLRKGDIYLVDSGGQYKFGTTDVTRTISLENSNGKIRNIFTRVLKGHIAVANFKLKNNTTGSIIDRKARKYLQEIGLNYAHGTGHGVGYFLNVHEGPHSISKTNKIKLKEGMILSNEPGYYQKNKFGIRIENLIYINRNKNQNYFENLTMVPIDKDLLEKKMLNKDEKEWLNTYHFKVFKNLRNFMNKAELLELKKACSAI